MGIWLHKTSYYGSLGQARTADLVINKVMLIVHFRL